MTQVLLTKPGVLTATDKKLLRQAGIVPIEAAKPSEVRLLQTEGSPISGDDLFFAALGGANKTYQGQQEFAELCFKLLKARREA
jgi:hypothetical protein